MTLRVIEGHGRPDDRFELTDFPLGPWAAAEVEVWTSKSGTRWHADPDCSYLKAQTRHDVLVQPSEGTLSELKLPEKLHCDPQGRLGTFRQAADYLVRFDDETHVAIKSLASEDTWLYALAQCLENATPHREEMLHELADGELSSYWQEAQTRRHNVLDTMRRRLTWRSRELATMLLAEWVRSGRTPGQHQRRYEHFLDIAVEELSARRIEGTIGVRHLVNQDVLPAWLDGIAQGRSFSRLTAELADSQRERVRRHGDGDPQEFQELAVRVHEAWLTAGLSWQRMLDAMALATEGEILILLDEPLAISYEMDRVLLAALPHARISAGHLRWVAATAPGALHPLLRPEKRRSPGIVLADNPFPTFDAERCALLLRNLLADLGLANLAHRVKASPPWTTSDDTSLYGEDDEDEFRSAYEKVPRRLLPEHYVRALRAAMRGQKL